MTNKLFMDIHVLQTVPPSCINRDDTGSPKTAVYGGVTRARVSSQAWKKAVRDMFRESSVAKDFEVGIRTKSLLKLSVKEIMAQNPEVEEDEAQALAVEIINFDTKNPIIVEKKGKKKDEIEDSVELVNEALFLVTPKQIASIADLALEYKESGKKPSKDDVISALNRNTGIDEALFGRMVAQSPRLNTEAAAQVAHSISTHRVVSEYDYFTAVDDIKEEEHAGAAHIGTNEFYSATLYRYATVSIHELEYHLGEHAAKAAERFLDAFVLSMPTGKQNTFANRSIPYEIFVTLREDQPINMAGAFERAITAGKDDREGYEVASLHALKNYAEKLHKEWLGEPLEKYYCGDVAEYLGEKLTYSNLKEKVYNYINKTIHDGKSI